MMITSSLLSSDSERFPLDAAADDEEQDILFGNTPLPTHSTGCDDTLALIDRIAFTSPSVGGKRPHSNNYSTADLEDILLRPVNETGLELDQSLDLFDTTSFLPAQPLPDLHVSTPGPEKMSFKSRTIDIFSALTPASKQPRPTPISPSPSSSSSSSDLNSDHVKPNRTLAAHKKVVPMHELIAGFTQKSHIQATPRLPQSLKIRVLEKTPLPNPLTPSFSKKVAVKARESQNRFREERRTYNEFLRRLTMNDTLDPSNEEEEEDREDEIFEGTNVNGTDEEDKMEDLESELSAVTTITRKEIVNLFVSEDEVEREDEIAVITARNTGDSDGGSPTKNKKERASYDLAAGIEVVAQSIQRAARFTNDVLARIERQLNLHSQLLSQTLALSGEIRGADQVWVASLKLLVKLRECYQRLKNRERLVYPGEKSLEMLLRILRQSPLHEALLDRIQQCSLLQDYDLRLRFNMNSIPFLLRHRTTGSSYGFSPSFWHILSIFSDGMDSEYSLAPNLTLPSNPPPPPPSSSSSSLGTRRRNTNPSLNPATVLEANFLRLTGRRNDSFLESEDRLLLLGLRRYGLGNWEKIQATLLPTRTAKQLSIRYKNLSARRAPSTPIKEFSQQLLQPLSRAEEELLVQGIRQCGFNWEWISMRFLPHRPPTILKRIWTEYERVSQRPRPFLEMTFPSEDDEDSEYYEPP